MKIKFKISIVIPTALITMISTLMIIYFNYSTSKDLALNMAEKVLDRHSKSVVLNLDSFFEPITNQTMFLAEVIDDKNYTQNEKRMEYLDLMIKHIDTFSQIAFINISDEKGNLTQVRSTPYPGIRIINKEINEEIWYRRTENSFQTTYVGYQNKFDPRLRTLYTRVRKEKRYQWSAPYRFKSIGKIGFTVSFPLFDKFTKEFFGTVSADIVVDSISNFLANEKVYDSETSYVINSDGLIMAYDDFELATKNIRIIYQGIENLDNKASFAYKEINGDLNRTHFFKYKDKSYISRLTPLNSKASYQLITVIDEDEVLGDINRTLVKNLIISFSLLAIALIILRQFLNNISKYIKKLMEQSDELTHLNFNKPIASSSIIDEIFLMQNSLESLRNAMLSFSKYIPFDLVGQIISNQSEAKLGGEKRELTLMFTDIADFTRISSEIPPDLLIKQLTEYFEEINGVVTWCDGVVDKYIGDGTMSFWGAPLKNPDNAVMACKAALKLKMCIGFLNEKWEKEEKKEIFKTRIGVNTGEAIVGNIGSKNRMNYTAMGDSVNMTSRLESLCKEYGVEIIISESTYIKVKDKFICKALGKVKVRGIKEKQLIYELIDFKKELD